MPNPDQPRTIADELLRAVDRDSTLADHLLGLARLVERLGDDLIELRAELDAERNARKRFEIRLLAEQVRENGLSLAPRAAGEHEHAGHDDPHAGEVVELVRSYAPEAERIPTTDQPTPDSIRVDDAEADPDA